MHSERYDPPLKRYRRDETADPTNPNPSIVVHVRNLTPKATEADLLEALSTFGPIAYATCIPHSRMALVEFEDLDGARACVSFSQSSQIFVGGQVALFNYSTSQCIERMGFECAEPNKVLVLTVLNALYPINADVIYEICNPHGTVLRIAVMHKPTVIQALVEFEDAETAKVAKHAMNGADIYSGCCTLKVEFAKPDYVKVTRQDQDQRDYTLPHTDAYDDPPSRRTLLQGSEPGPPGYGYEYGGRGGYRGRGRWPSRGYHGGGYGRESYADRFDTGGYSGHGPPQYHEMIGGQGCVLMVYGIEQDKINCEMLFNILCLYGNVMRISFMRSKTETGMIEMGAPSEVTNVLNYLQNIELFGLKLEFKPSHQEGVHNMRDPFPLPDGTPSFRDYTNSRNQRFTTPENAARNRIVHPTRFLHWFNAPANMDEAKLRELLREKKCPEAITVDAMPSRTDRSATGTIEFSTVEEANEALALANHTPVVSPVGKAPYIVKLAYATPKRYFEEEKTEESSEQPSEEHEEGRIKEAEDVDERDHRNDRGYGGSSREYRGGYRGEYRGRGGYRGRGRGEFRGDFRGGYRPRGSFRSRGRPHHDY